ncbi:MAG: hypothetical protein MRY67_10600 [Rhodovulum sp.]|nr:hypothetical protein [Rhodovulum sp.]
MSTFVALLETLVAVSQIVMAGAVAFGVWVAYKQLGVWRSEHISKRRAEIAEQLLTAALDVQRVISNVRSPLEFIPQDTKNSRVSIINMKAERLQSYAGDFERLSSAKVLYEAYSGDVDVDEAVNEIFRVRAEVAAALQTLIQLPEGTPSDHVLNLDRKIYEMGGEYDELKPRVVSSIQVLREKLLPDIRMA